MSTEINGLDSNIFLENLSIDRILGTIYGQALGDAYGLATEFMSKKEIGNLYSDSNQLIPFPYYKRNNHNSRWTQGDYTDDTDNMIIIMQMFTESQGNVNLNLLANKLKGWVKNGFSECGDIRGMGIGQTTFQVSSHPQFENYPLDVSKRFWINNGKDFAANGAVMRTSVVGCVATKQKDIVRENSIKCCQYTHYDSRCVISCTTATNIISSLVENQDKDISSDCIENLIKESIDSSKEILKNQTLVDQQTTDKHLEDYLKHMSVKGFSELELDDATKIGYTLKCIGSAVYSLRRFIELSKLDSNSGKDIIFRKVLDELIREGGDADTNGSISGAMIGSLIGYSQLPKDMLKALPYKLFLDKHTSQFINNVILNNNIIYKLPELYKFQDTQEFSIDLNPVKVEKEQEQEEKELTLQDIKKTTGKDQFCTIQ